VENRWKAVGLLVFALVAIVVGSEMLVEGSKTVIEQLGLSDTFFGMVILALLVSIEEVARELPAALRGHPEISFGNVVGSALAFFLFNAGLIALVRPVEIGRPTLRFYLPVALATTIVISLFMVRKAVPRWAGAVLVALYALFVVGGYLTSETQALKMFQ
jgi:cation:H+ antiporter